MIDALANTINGDLDMTVALPDKPGCASPAGIVVGPESIMDIGLADPPLIKELMIESIGAVSYCGSELFARGLPPVDVLKTRGAGGSFTVVGTISVAGCWLLCGGPSIR